MDQPSAVQLWGAIKAWYAEHLPEVPESLNPGASEQALREFENELKDEVSQNLPQGLRDIYLQNDGQKRTITCGMFFGLEFLSLTELMRLWRGWKDIASNPFYAGMNEFSTSHPAAAIRQEYALTGWIPFAYDWGGNHLGVDVNPGPAGQVGQVINFGRDENNKFVIAPSFTAFLGWQLAQLQNGNFLITTENYDGGLERCVELHTPSNSHLLDAVPKLFGPKDSPLDRIFSVVPFGQKPKS